MGLFDFFKKGVNIKKIAKLFEEVMYNNHVDGRLRGEGVTSCGLLENHSTTVNKTDCRYDCTIVNGGLPFEFFLSYNQSNSSFCAGVKVSPYTQFQYNKFADYLKKNYKPFYISGGTCYPNKEDYHFYIMFGGFTAKTEDEILEFVHQFRMNWQNCKLQADLIEIFKSAGYCNLEK